MLCCVLLRRANLLALLVRNVTDHASNCWRSIAVQIDEFCKEISVLSLWPEAARYDFVVV